MSDVLQEPRYAQDPENHPARNIRSVEATGVLLDNLPPSALKVYEEMFLKRLERLEAEMAAGKGKKQPEEPSEKPATTPISLRVPNDVLERWKAGGQGWQTRMVQRLSAP